MCQCFQNNMNKPKTKAANWPTWTLTAEAAYVEISTTEEPDGFAAEELIPDVPLVVMTLVAIGEDETEVEPDLTMVTPVNTVVVVSALEFILTPVEEEPFNAVEVDSLLEVVLLIAVWGVVVELLPAFDDGEATGDFVDGTTTTVELAAFEVVSAAELGFKLSVTVDVTTTLIPFDSVVKVDNGQ